MVYGRQVKNTVVEIYDATLATFRKDLVAVVKTAGAACKHGRVEEQGVGRILHWYVRRYTCFR